MFEENTESSPNLCNVSVFILEGELFFTVELIVKVHNIFAAEWILFWFLVLN